MTQHLNYLYPEILDGINIPSKALSRYFELENKIFYLSKHKSLFPHFFSKGTLLCSERGRGLWIPWISRLPPGDFGLFVFQISAFPPVYHFLNRNPNSTTFDHTNTPLLLPPWFFWNIYGLQKIIYIL